VKPGDFNLGGAVTVKPKPKPPDPERIRRLRLHNLITLLRDRCGWELPDDDAGREYLVELLLPISTGPNAAIKMPRAIEVWAPWMDNKEAGAIIDQINLMPICERKPNAKVLGERLRVLMGERTRLCLWTIFPCDMTDAGMELWRKRRKRKRDRLYRQRRGRKSRAAYLASHAISKEKPWIAVGFKCRRTWERHGKPMPANGVASVRHVKLVINAAADLRHHQQPPASKKESAEKKPSISSIKPTPQPQKPEKQVNDTVVTVTALVPATYTCDNELMPRTYATTEQPALGHNGGPAMDVDVPYYPPGMNGYGPAPSAEQEQDLRGMPKDSLWLARP
jgi:hypothetical protein